MREERIDRSPYSYIYIIHSKLMMNDVEGAYHMLGQMESDRQLINPEGKTRPFKTRKGSLSLSKVAMPIVTLIEGFIHNGLLAKAYEYYSLSKRAGIHLMASVLILLVDAYGKKKDHHMVGRLHYAMTREERGTR